MIEPMIFARAVINPGDAIAAAILAEAMLHCKASVPGARDFVCRKLKARASLPTAQKQLIGIAVPPYAFSRQELHGNELPAPTRHGAGSCLKWIGRALFNRTVRYPR
jgi:hypothetical protein